MKFALLKCAIPKFTGVRKPWYAPPARYANSANLAPSAFWPGYAHVLRWAVGTFEQMVFLTILDMANLHTFYIVSTGVSGCECGSTFQYNFVVSDVCNINGRKKSHHLKI